MNILWLFMYALPFWLVVVISGVIMSAKYQIKGNDSFVIVNNILLSAFNLLFVVFLLVLLVVS